MKWPWSAQQGAEDIKAQVLLEVERRVQLAEELFESALEQKLDNVVLGIRAIGRNVTTLTASVEKLKTECDTTRDELRDFRREFAASTGRSEPAKAAPVGADVPDVAG